MSNLLEHCRARAFFSISLALLSATLTGCVVPNQSNDERTTPSTSAQMAHPVASAHEMRDRSREIIRELLAMIPQELSLIHI